jgi:ADP-heptose:LPS heptosyltransferase
VSLENGRRFDLPPDGRIAVLRALQLGDMLCAIPACRALRAAWPYARLTVVGLPWARELVRRFDGIFDDFVELPGFPGLPEQPVAAERWPEFVSEVRARRFDLVLQMHGDGRISNRLAALCRGRRTAGFFAPGHRCPDRELFLAYPDDGPEVRRLLALVAFLGVPVDEERLEFPIRSGDHRAAARLDADGVLRHDYVCVHPGARAASRRWAPERFAEVAERLSAQGLRIVLTGSAAERPLTERVAAGIGAPVLNLAGRTSLGELGAVLAGARLLISNDTGVAHLADALGVPSVVLFEPSQVARWASLDRATHRVVCPASDARPDRVLAEAEPLLAGHAVRNGAS